MVAEGLAIASIRTIIIITMPLHTLTVKTILVLRGLLTMTPLTRVERGECTLTEREVANGKGKDATEANVNNSTLIQSHNAFIDISEYYQRQSIHFVPKTKCHYFGCFGVFCGSLICNIPCTHMSTFLATNQSPTFMHHTLKL
jgi:hypothetical protein